MKNFSRVKQLTGSYCGPAVFQMLLFSLGLKLDQEQLVDVCGARETVMKVGIPLTNLAEGVQKLFPEVAVWMKSETELKDIQGLLKAGYLVGFDWQGVFTRDEYGDDQRDKWEEIKNKLVGLPRLKGDQGHYCVVVDIDLRKGYLRFADPYGHYAGKDRFIAIWEFEERWWDDRVGKDENGKKIYILENRLMFVVAKKGDKGPKKWGMVEI